jgi:hypothetical protein
MSEASRVAVVAFAVVELASLRASARQAQGPPADPLVRENASVKPSEHVYAIPDFNVGGVPNVGIIVGNKATLVVDTGLGPRNGQAILREVAKVSIDEQRTMMRAIQARAVELKREGKSADDTARTVQMEFQTKYPDWMGAAQAGNAARTAYQEAP